MEPSGCRKYTALTKSPMLPSAVPAFIASAPPTVAGMPTSASMPPRLSAAASRMSEDRLTPAPATASSPWNSARPRQPSSLSTTPRTPRSRTSRLLPPPRTATGNCSRSAKSKAWRMSSTSCGTTKMSAKPPMRNDVWKLSGSLNRTSPRISPSIYLPPLGRGTLAGFPSPPPVRRLAFEPSQNVRSQLAHVAGAQGEDQVPGPADLGHVLDDARPIAAEKRHVAVAVGTDALRQIRGTDAGNRRLARWIDVHDDQHVGLVERGEELLTEVPRPGVAVRLEHRDDPAVEPGLGGGEGRADLGGVMAVVVDHGHARRRATDLESALHAGEAGQRLGDRQERNLEIEPH